MATRPEEALEKTFLLFLGAQKSGSSALAQALRDSPGATLGLCKEYHVLDALFVPETAHQRLGALPAEAPPDSPPALVRARRRDRLRYRMQQDLEVYADYFADLLDRDGVRLAADVTPAHAGLPAGAIRDIRGRFARRGIRVIGLFIMRDPVERAWSTVRMDQARSLADEGVPLGVPEDEALRRYAATRHAVLRGAYHRTLSAMAEAFPPQERHVDLYERMFTEAGFARLGAALGVPLGQGVHERRINETRRADTLSDATRRVVAETFREAYAAAAGAFGASEVRRCWPSAAYLDDAWRSGPGPG